MYDVYYEGRPVKFSYNALLVHADPESIIKYSKASIIYVFETNKIKLSE